MATLLEQWMEANSVSQEALADRIGVTQSYVSRLLTRTRHPGLDVALAIERETGGGVPVGSWAAPKGGRKARRRKPKTRRPLSTNRIVPQPSQ